MSQKALKVWAEVKLGAVSCPGVRLSAKDDIFLSLFFMDQLHQSESLPAVFPLLFHQKMTFEKIFRHAADPKDIALLLEKETVRIELVQLIPPAGDTLASYEEDARSFLFPEPKLVPPFSGLGREVLMMRAAHFRVTSLLTFAFVVGLVTLETCGVRMAGSRTFCLARMFRIVYQPLFFTFAQVFLH
ncbi:PREDICTED: spermatogenesis associated 6-like protein, partial [Cyprinodon variegatus]|uniref:spermatogenesis associated 6-like protein n=1 Tax=Cyprinodon variegatus TaxID=28743 RepID=UPI000742544F